MPTPIGAGYSDYIGARASKANPSVTEFYDTKTGQGFSDPTQLAGYANLIAGRNDLTGDNVFGALQQGFTPRAAAIEQITQSLNQQQNSAFSEQSAPKRASSSLADSIAADQGNIDSSLAEFASLKEKLSNLAAPNYQQTYTDLYNSQGLPQLNSDIATNNKTIRELPYLNRMNSGNVGVMTEGQLGADTQQKGIPLEIQQANLLDQLKLAQDFISNSLDLKEKDYNTSQEGITNAINLVGQTLQYTRQHLQDLQAKQADQMQAEELAQKFAFDNRITKPFYEVAGTVYRTSDRTPAHNQAEYISMGGTGDFSDVQKIVPKEDLSGYPASYQEYLLAKQDGFTGNYTDYQNADANGFVARIPKAWCRITY